MRSDRGSGSVLALAVLGAVTMIAIVVLTLGSALVVRQRVVGAADAAALAAADGVSGAVAGEPCVLAGRLAAAGGARLSTCTIDGLVATVRVSSRFGAVPFAVRARAGPPS